MINHGISQEFMDEVFDQSRRFFALPLSVKMELLRNEKHRGYTPLLDELLDPENQVHGAFSLPPSECYRTLKCLYFPARIPTLTSLSIQYAWAAHL